MSEQKIMKQLADNLKMEFGVKELSVYRGNDKVFGKALDNALIEKYFSLPCSTVFKNTGGSTFVTRFLVGRDNYIIALYSDNTATFDGQEAEYIIADIKKLQRKLGE